MTVEKGQMLYEIVAKTRKDEFCVCVKRSLADFISLDNSLEKKYG